MIWSKRHKTPFNGWYDGNYKTYFIIKTPYDGFPCKCPKL